MVIKGILHATRQRVVGQWCLFLTAYHHLPLSFLIMPPVIHSEQEESDFMNDLLFGVDDSFFNAVPSPDPTPKKGHVLGRTTSRLSLIQRTPTKNRTPRKALVKSPLSTRKNASAGNDQGLDLLLEGAESWDWDDMNTDFLTPEHRDCIQHLNVRRKYWSY